jgi:hypothetical protein
MYLDMLMKGVFQMSVDKILEGLTQQERLDLLERLMRSDFRDEESSSRIEERLERLEDLLLNRRQRDFGRRSRRFSWGGPPCFHWFGHGDID